MKPTALIFITLLFLLIDTISTGFLECSDTAECSDIGICENSVCECPLGQVYNLEGTKCLSVAIGYEAECEDDPQCGWLLGKYHCNNGKCDCQEGWRYYAGQCLKITGFNESCTADQDCFNNYDILAMVCKDGICDCNEGYYLRGDYDCRPEATQFGDYCSLHSDCKMENGICTASKCVDNATETNFVQNRYDLEDLPIIKPASTDYDLDCTTDQDCSLLLGNSTCYPLIKKCVCKRGFYLSGDVCIPELGVDIKCATDDQCPTSLGRCNPKDGKCYCPKTYFYAKSNRACQKPMTHDNLFCNTEERCRVYGMEVTCLTNKCRCLTTAQLDDDYVCRPVEDTGLGGRCNGDEDCFEVTNAICNEDAKCDCPKNYRLEETTCLPNIGGGCDAITKPCTIENANCGTDQICSCIESYVPNGVTGCLKRSTGLDGECEIDLQCSDAVNFTKCATNSTCQCIDNYIGVNETCFLQKFVGDICTNSADCHVMLGSNMQCRNSICQCSADMQLTADGLNCESAASSIFLQINAVILATVCYLALKLSTM